MTESSEVLGFDGNSIGKVKSGTISALRQWPDPPAVEAYYGLAGDVVRAIGPHTEASPVALLVQTLLCFGNINGRTAHFTAEASKHFMNIYAVLVGVSSVGRKGSSWAQVLRLFRMVDPEWGNPEVKTTRILSGLSSGEGLIWAVRDPILRIPMKVFSDSDWIPVTGSEVKLIVFGAKRRWRSYRA